MATKLITDFFIQKEKLLEDRETRLSKECLSDLISDDFLEILGNGEQCGKEEVIIGIIEDTKKGFDYTSSNFEVLQISEDVGCVMYQTESLNNKSVISYYQRSSFWKNEDGVWRNIFHQATRII